MGNYVTVQNIKDALPQLRITASSKPTEAQVGEIIDVVESYVDASVAGLGFLTPVTATLSKKILRDMVTKEVSSRVIVEQVAGIRDPKELGSDTLHGIYVQMLKLLMDPNDPFTLPDAEKANYDEKVAGAIEGLGMTSGFIDEVRITRDQEF